MTAASHSNLPASLHFECKLGYEHCNRYIIVRRGCLERDVNPHCQKTSASFSSERP